VQAGIEADRGAPPQTIQCYHLNGLALDNPARLQETHMTAYFIAESVVTDPQGDSAVIARLPATTEAYGGRYLARGGRIVSFGGEAPRRVVIVAFDSLADAERWRADPQVKALEEERRKTGTTLRLYAVEGLPQ
jgi:uncharacterized protein (DUF1330 family)